MRHSTVAENRTERLGIGRHTMHKTRNDLPEKTREKVIEICNARLADCTDLVSHAKTAHWNVKGPNFIGLHELFDKVYEETSEHVDLIAERCAQLGGTVLGTVRQSAASSNLEEYPTDIFTCEEHVRHLSRSLSAFGRLVREAIQQCDELGDQDSMDIFTEISRDIDKYLWFVEAHVQEER